MKKITKILLSTLATFGIAATAYASVFIVPQGGTGLLYPVTGFQTNSCLIGNGINPIATTTCSMFAFPFTPTTFGSTPANATSTLIGFLNGLYSLASSTIGNGTQTGGLTVSGGATTTGSAYIAGSLGIDTPTPSAFLHVTGATDKTQIIAQASTLFVGTTSPSGISGLKTWYKADSIAQSDGTAVSSWTDSSGNGATATQGTGTFQPILKLNILNGKPVVRFDGSNDRLTSSLSQSTPYTLYVVAYYRSTCSSQKGILDGGADVQGYLFCQGGTTNQMYFNNGPQVGPNTTNTVVTPTIFKIVVNGAASSITESAGSAVTGTLGAVSLTGFRLGERGNTSEFGDVDMAEVILYDHVLTSADQIKVGYYLGDKYGITMPPPPSVQTSDIQDWEDSAGNILANVTGAGRFGVGLNIIPQYLVDIRSNGDGSSLGTLCVGNLNEGCAVTVDGTNGIFKAGDVSLGVNGTLLTVDDVLQKMTFTAPVGVPAYPAGFGTSTPSATVAIESELSTGDAFVIATSTGKTIAGVDNDGHRFTGGPKPTISSCGTGSPSVTGDDQTGTITTGTGATSCTATFAKAYRATPVCNFNDDSATIPGDISSISTTAVTFALGAGLTGGHIYYQCSYHR